MGMRTMSDDLAIGFYNVGVRQSMLEQSVAANQVALSYFGERYRDRVPESQTGFACHLQPRRQCERPSWEIHFQAINRKAIMCVRVCCVCVCLCVRVFVGVCVLA